MRSRVFLVGVVTALITGACSSGSPTVTSGSPTGPAGTVGATAAVTIPPASAPAPVETGPATFQVTLSGDPSVTGAWQTGNGINCSNPTLAGVNILAFATSADGQSVVVLTVTQGQVNVSERAGSGTSYTAREFKGTGVTDYDPAKGATIDSDVEIVPTPDVKPGTLGTITHVKATIACNGQTTGTSTVVASGSSAEGAIAGPFTTFRVICGSSAKDGLSVTIIGVIATTTPPVYMIANLPANGNATIFTITENPSKQHSYAIDKATTATVSSTGAHLDASYVEVLAAGSADQPHTIHLAGDVTCGTTNKS